jgi:flagellar M-ring protein FliF
MNINDAKAGLKKRLGFAPDFFNKLDKKKKILFVSGAVICLVITIMLIRFVTKSSIVPLYTDIDLRDAAAITEYLEDKNISYELKDEGGTILVPEDQKYQIRLDLANNGLPQGNVIGFESFDEMRFGETESTQKVRYTAALQGELERTISKIEGVDDVRVHIVMPEESLFVEDKKEATSSVFLNLKPGYSLKDTQVHGITRLVASGVEGLTAENVTVVDSEGNVLSDSIGEKNQIGGKFTADHLQLKLDYEKRLNNSLQSMLERVVGSEKAVVRSNVVFDFDQVEISQEDYGDREIRKSHTIEETSTDGAAAQGQPGTGANIPDYQQVENQEGTYNQKTEKIIDYEIDKETTHRLAAPGKIERISVSVLLGDEFTLQQQQMIADMVASAVGVRPESEDRVTVTCLPFGSVEEEAGQGIGGFWNRSLWFIIIIIILVAAFLLFWLLRRNKTETMYSEQEAMVQDLLNLKQQEIMTPSPEQKEEKEMLGKLRKLARNNSKDTAEVLKSWLSNDQR